ncbi:MAG: amino acid permease [Alphaproteobacteria bacterium]|nr:amino acid permease [Alphaproteobacteria bacterium]
MSQKIGFSAVFAIVTGSQIGSSVFTSPANLAGYGWFALWGFMMAGAGAMALCWVFATLCAAFPKTGGPHVYVHRLFGRAPAFFTGWTYWVISWISTTAVVVTAVGYLAPLMGLHDKWTLLSLQLLLLGLITYVNLQGVKIAGQAEFVLTLLKLIPLIVLPLGGLMFFKVEHFQVAPTLTESFSFSQLLGQMTLLTLWGFIGLETATTPAESVENPTKNIPKAMILGTLFVAVVYIINCLGIMGLVPPEVLKNSKAPYVDASQILFGGHWHLLISVIAGIVCVGTLNAWMLTSGQIALGLSQDGFMPALFAKTNKKEAPVWSILISAAGIVPLLFMTMADSFADQIRSIIDISVTAFLFVYSACCFGAIKLALRANKYLSAFVSLIALLFCAWIIYETPLATLGQSCLFTLSGVPVYLFWYLKKGTAAPKALSI